MTVGVASSKALVLTLFTPSSDVGVCFGEGEAGELHLCCRVTAWWRGRSMWGWGSWDFRDSETCMVWVTASRQEPVSEAVTWPLSCPSLSLVTVSATPTGNSLFLTSGLSLSDRERTSSDRSSYFFQSSAQKEKNIRIPGSLSCPLMLAPLLPGEFREEKKDENSLAKPVCLFTANTFCSGLCSCFHSWKGNIFLP